MLQAFQGLQVLQAMQAFQVLQAMQAFQVLQVSAFLQLAFDRLLELAFPDVYILRGYKTLDVPEVFRRNSEDDEIVRFALYVYIVRSENVLFAVRTEGPAELDISVCQPELFKFFRFDKYRLKTIIVIPPPELLFESTEEAEDLYRYKGPFYIFRKPPRPGTWQSRRRTNPRIVRRREADG